MSWRDDGGNQKVYWVDHDRWFDFLDLEKAALPTYVDWVAFYRSAWLLLEWMSGPGMPLNDQGARVPEVDDVVLASDTRKLVGEIAPGIRRVGLHAPAIDRHFGTEFLGELIAMVDGVTDWLHDTEIRTAR